MLTAFISAPSIGSEAISEPTASNNNNTSCIMMFAVRSCEIMWPIFLRSSANKIHLPFFRSKFLFYLEVMSVFSSFLGLSFFLSLFFIYPVNISISLSVLDKCAIFSCCQLKLSELIMFRLIFSNLFFTFFNLLFIKFVIFVCLFGLYLEIVIHPCYISYYIYACCNWSMSRINGHPTHNFSSPSS